MQQDGIQEYCDRSRHVWLITEAQPCGGDRLWISDEKKQQIQVW